MQPGEVRISVEGAGVTAEAMQTLDKWLAGEKEQSLRDRPRRTVPREGGEPVLGLLYDLVVNLGTDVTVALAGVLIRSLHSHLRNQPEATRSLTLHLPDGGSLTLTGEDMTQGQFEALTLQVCRGLGLDEPPRG